MHPCMLFARLRPNALFKRSSGSEPVGPPWSFKNSIRLLCGGWDPVVGGISTRAYRGNERVSDWRHCAAEFGIHKFPFDMQNCVVIEWFVEAKLGGAIPFTVNPEFRGGLNMTVFAFE